MSSQEIPSDAARIMDILVSMGVTEHEPRVVNQLLDFVYRYTADILQDAEAYAEHAGKAKGEVELDDVMLAIQLNASTSFVPPPSQDVLLELADKINKVPIPAPKKQHGLHLPPDEHCLTNPNYQVPPGATLTLPVIDLTQATAPEPGVKEEAEKDAGASTAAAAEGAEVVATPTATPAAPNQPGPGSDPVDEVKEAGALEAAAAQPQQTEGPEAQEGGVSAAAAAPPQQAAGPEVSEAVPSEAAAVQPQQADGEDVVKMEIE